MSEPKHQAAAPTAGQALAAEPALAPLLAGADPAQPLDWAALTARYAPGQPLDRLGLAVVILQYLRTRQA